jgi:hypothetical protein
MRNLRKLLGFLFLVIYVTGTILMVPSYADNFPSIPQINNINQMVQAVDNDFINSLGIKPKVPQIAADAIKKGITPSTFQNITYELNENVEWLNEEVVEALKTHAENGVIAASELDGIELDANKVYVDKSSGTALRLIEGDNGKVTILDANEDELVKEINIPEQNINLNSANISFVADGVECSTARTKSVTGQQEQYILTFNESMTVPGYDKEGKKIEVKLKGDLIIKYPTVETKYTKKDGYKFIFSAGEEANVSAELYAELKKEIKIPLTGFDIDSDACKVNVGIFLIIDINGKITMNYEFNQHLNVRAGIRGGTYYYIPTSVKSVLEKDFGFETEEFSLNAEINGETDISTQVTFDILGKGKVIVDIRLGLRIEAKYTNDANTDTLSIKGDGIFKITGKIKIKSFDKKKDLISYKYPLFEYTKAKKSNYSIEVKEACAYEDLLKIQVMKYTGTNSKTPYANSEISIKVVDSKGKSAIVKAVTDSNGECTKQYTLVKGSTVSVKVPESENLWTEPVNAVFPFNNVVVASADYLFGDIRGYISGNSDGTLEYNGPVRIVVEGKENIPMTAAGKPVFPIDQTIGKTVNCINGSFELNNTDLKPYDKVSAYIDRDGFKVASDKLESSGIDLYSDGNYIQESDRLYSPGNYIFAAYDENYNSSIQGDIKLKLEVYYPHGNNPDNTKIKEWTLPLMTGAESGISTAEIGEWEMKLTDTIFEINPLLDGIDDLINGSDPIKYHVKETIEYYCKGKRIEISKEVKTCDIENGGIMNLWDRLNNIGNIFDEEFVTTNNDILSKPNVSGIIPDLPNKTMIEPKVGNIIIPAQEIKGGYTCNVSVKKYTGNMSLHSETDRMKLYVLGNKMKIETSNNIDIYLDDDTMSKNLCYKESQTIESVRYDGKDYIPELSDIEFVQTGSEGIGKSGCNIYEKHSKDKKTILKIFESKDTKLPQKIVLTNGTNTIEITYTNYSFDTVANSDVTF